MKIQDEAIDVINDIYKTVQDAENNGVFEVGTQNLKRWLERAKHPTTTEMQCDEGCEYECTKGGTQPKSCETLQEGDYTKCEKFSEWVALFEFEGSNSSFDQFWRDEFNEFNGEVKATDGINLDGILLWGKGENFLPYQEFKSRAINTFKTK